MHPRLFRLFEAHQHIDESLRQAQTRADRSEIDRLSGLKAKAKYLITRFLTAPVPAMQGRG